MLLLNRNARLQRHSRSSGLSVYVSNNPITGFMQDQSGICWGSKNLRSMRDLYPSCLLHLCCGQLFHQIVHLKLEWGGFGNVSRINSEGQGQARSQGLGVLHCRSQTKQVFFSAKHSTQVLELGCGMTQLPLCSFRLCIPETPKGSLPKAGGL